MKTYSTSDLVRAVGDVTHAAAAEPVIITHHAKPRYVLMSIGTFEHLTRTTSDPRRAWRSGEAPADLLRPLVAAVDNSLAGLEPADGD